MRTHKMMVLAKAAAGRTEELARWYDETHIPDLLEVPGVVSAERHTLSPIKQPAGSPGWDFMVIYELAGEDPLAIVAAMGAAKVDPCLDSMSTLALIGTSAGKLQAG